MSKLAISNLAWNTNQEQNVLEYLKRNNIQGLEIAPTKIFGNSPFSKIDLFKEYSKKVKEDYGLSICSFQSIWYGLDVSLSDFKNHPFLIDYTKDVIKCASVVDCKNIVFGNPKLRNGCRIDDPNIISFFTEIGEYAKKYNTCISIEPNPAIYGTDFLNRTDEAIDFCKNVNSDGLKVNLDFGTIICNHEPVEGLLNVLDNINHIHISEPFLKMIESRSIHSILKDLTYDKYISIEMNETSLENIAESITYLQSLF